MPAKVQLEWHIQSSTRMAYPEHSWKELLKATLSKSSRVFQPLCLEPTEAAAWHPKPSSCSHSYMSRSLQCPCWLSFVQQKITSASLCVKQAFEATLPCKPLAMQAVLSSHMPQLLIAAGLTTFECYETELASRVKSCTGWDPA